MLRLTLRSGKDGRFLARIVEQGGFPFVLDFGDRRIIEDATQRLQHGFTMWRYGKLVAANPNDPELMMLLAEFYASEGLLVTVEEPTWTGRDRSENLDARLPPNPADDVWFTPPPDALPELAERDDATELADPDAAELGPEPDTELVDFDRLPDLGDDLETAEVTPPPDAGRPRRGGRRETVRLPKREPDDDIEDAKTEIVERDDE